MSQIMGLPADDLLKPTVKDMTIWEAYMEGRKGAIKDALIIIDDELASWERVRKEMNYKPEDDNAEAALALVRSLIAELTEDKS